VATAPLVSVVIPAHNERDSLRRVVADVGAALGSWSHEIVLIDDGSSDGTWDEIRALKAERSGVRGIRFTRNFGHQAALAAGLRAASGSAVIMMDADGQHPTGLLATFVRLWEEGHPVVQGVRTASSGESWLKASTSRLFYWCWSTLSGVPITRGTADFRLIDRHVLENVLATGGSMIFLRGLIPWLGYPISCVSFQAGPRLAGRSRYTWRRMLRFSLDGLLAFSVVPLRLAMALGISMALISFVYLCYVVFIWFYSLRVVSGWASTAGLVALVGGIQLFTIGVLGEYVGRIFLRTTDRPQFVIAERL
jgi:glycosyltransferase involved in cell wall biosynthesis